MTLIEDIRKIQDSVAIVMTGLEEAEKTIARHDEQISGQRGLSAAIDSLSTEVKSLRKAAYWVGGVIVAGAIGFAFTVLTLIPS